jgi:GTP cyclohydrolase I
MSDFIGLLGIPSSELDDLSLDISSTPARVLRMLKDELLSSYKPGAFRELLSRFTCFPSDGQDAMVLEADISFTSLCAHHMLPFSGVAHVAYIPNDLIVGASKLARAVEYYSHMLQIQERLARQIADFVAKRANAKVVIVMIEATHSCMTVRGVKQANSRLITTAVRPQPGGNEDYGIRPVIDEFYNQLALLRR